MLKTLKRKTKKFKNHFSYSFLSFSLYKIHFSATKQSHREKKKKRKKEEDFFLLYAASSPSTSLFHFPQNSLKLTTFLFLTLSKLTTPSLSSTSTSTTIAFLIVDKSIQSPDLRVHFSKTFLLKFGDEYAHRNSKSFRWSLFKKSIFAGGNQIAGTETKSKPSWRNSRALGRMTSLSSWTSWHGGAWVGNLHLLSHEPLVNLWIWRRTCSNSTKKKTTPLLDSHCPWLTWFLFILWKFLGLERIEFSLSLSLSEKMFRNLEVKVFGKCLLTEKIWGRVRLRFI